MTGRRFREYGFGPRLQNTAVLFGLTELSNSLKSVQPQSALSARQADKLILETAGHVKQTHESDACHVFWALPGQGLQLCASGSVELLGPAPIVKQT